MPFSSSQLSQLRGMAASFFDLTCSVLTRVVSSNAAGSQTVSYAVSEVNLPCHVRPRKREPYEAEETGAMTAVKRFDVLLPYDASVSVQSRIAVNSGAVLSVVAGATGTTQQLSSTSGLLPRSWLYFSGAQQAVQVIRVMDSTHVLLAGTVATSTGEQVLVASLFEVIGHDSGKSYQTKIICDCVRIDDGSQ